jgi:hypothetical protein
MTTPTVASIRASLGEGTDGESIRRLARLTQAEPPEGAVVLAEICGAASPRRHSQPDTTTPQRGKGRT